MNGFVLKLLISAVPILTLMVFLFAYIRHVSKRRFLSHLKE